MAYDYIGISNKVLTSFGETKFADNAEFVAATGFHEHVINAVNWGIADIYNLKNNYWPFLNAETTQVLLTDGTVKYAPTALAQKVDFKSMYIERDDALDDPDEAQDLNEKNWEVYRERDLIDSLNADAADYTKPDYVTESPDGEIYVGPLPADQAYTLNYRYTAKFIALSASTDVPLIPEQFEQVIITAAQVYCYAFRDNNEQELAAQEKTKRKVDAMARVLIPLSSSVTSNR